MIEIRNDSDPFSYPPPPPPHTHTKNKNKKGKKNVPLEIKTNKQNLAIFIDNLSYNEFTIISIDCTHIFVRFSRTGNIASFLKKRIIQEVICSLHAFILSRLTQSFASRFIRITSLDRVLIIIDVKTILPNFLQTRRRNKIV